MHYENGNIVVCPDQEKRPMSEGQCENSMLILLIKRATPIKNVMWQEYEN